MQSIFTVAILLFGHGVCAAHAQLPAGGSALARRLLGSTTNSGNDMKNKGTASSTPTTTSSTPSTGSTSSSSGTIGTGSAAADPQVVDFSGRHFEFLGEIGSLYNVIQDPTHQVSMRLKLGILSDHNGTYIDGLGFAYQGHKIVMELVKEDTDEIIVSLDGKQLVMGGSETEQEHEMMLPQGKLRLTWELYRPNYGNTITIETDLLRFTVYRTDKGSLDKGGLPQPAFLNFDAKLLFPPAHTLQGIVGEGYTRVLAGEAHKLPNDGTFYGNPDDYLMSHYFPEDSPATHKVLLPSTRVYRSLMEVLQGQDSLIAAVVASLDISALPEAHAGGSGRLARSQQM